MHSVRRFHSPIFGASLRPHSATVAILLMLLFFLLVLLLVLLTPQPAQAQTFKVIHTFTGGADGAWPYAGLTMDRAGNLYGTAQAGGGGNLRSSGCGGSGCGTVFKLVPRGSGWVFTTLYSFQGGSDGAVPTARVIFGPDGSLYGTTSVGGAGYGTVFKLQPPLVACKSALCPWTETVLYRFTGGSDGANPGGGDLIFDKAGNLYGTAQYGGYEGGSCSETGGCGVVFELTPSSSGWIYSVIHRFTGGADGGYPYSGVISDNAGNLYGTAGGGGSSGGGTVYELIPSGSGWQEKTLCSFPTGRVVTKVQPAA